jgi:hypothetical protein
MINIVKVKASLTVRITSIIMVKGIIIPHINEKVLWVKVQALRDTWMNLHLVNRVGYHRSRFLNIYKFKLQQTIIMGN